MLWAHIIKTRTSWWCILVWRSGSLFLGRDISFVLRTHEISLHKNNSPGSPDRDTPLTGSCYKPLDSYLKLWEYNATLGGLFSGLLLYGSSPICKKCCVFPHLYSVDDDYECTMDYELYLLPKCFPFCVNIRNISLSVSYYTSQTKLYPVHNGIPCQI